MSDIYERYAEIRDRKGLNDSQIASLTGLRRSTFSEWKAGKYTPKQDTLDRIASALGVSLQYLLKGEESYASEKLGHYIAYILNNDDTRLILEILPKLKPNNQKALMKYAQFLSSEQQKDSQ